MRNKNHIKHITNSIPEDVVAQQTSFYTVALEAWRRGLKIKYFNRNRGGKIPSLAITYSISDGENEYSFVCARGSKSKREAILKAENKTSAYKYMKENGVPIPESKTFKFSENSVEEMCNYGVSIGFPLVVKPTNMGGGKGVTTHIDSKKKLKDAILDIKNNYRKSTVIIEKYFEGGVDFRFYIIENEVLAVAKSYSANIIGDGKNTIQELINKRNIQIKNNITTKRRVIKIDDEMLDFLSENNYTLDSVPKDGKRVFVRKHGTHLGKRLNVDCTETVDPKFKKIAVDALNSIPGLPTGSVDMIINEDRNEGIVNEINTKGEIMMHIFPVEGKARDIPKHLIDYYFPGSVKISDNFYFEYKPVKDLFLDGYADEITIPMHPETPQFHKEYSLIGERFTKFPLMKFKKKAANLNFKGSINLISDEKLVINLIGSQENFKKFESFIKNSNLKIQEYMESELKPFEGVSSIGFNIIDSTN